MQLRWSHAFVHVQDMDAMVGFYTDVLGFEVTDTGEVGGAPVTFMSQVETDHHQFAFLERPAAEAAGGAEAAGRAAALPNRVGHFAFRVASLGDVKALHERLQADDRVPSVAPVTHGNAWSVYFKDPEGNGIEVFCDTPWHVAQPQGGAWDPAKSEAEVHADTEARFAAADGFGPIEDFYRARAEHLARR